MTTKITQITFNFTNDKAQIIFTYSGGATSVLETTKADALNMITCLVEITTSIMVSVKFQ